MFKKTFMMILMIVLTSVIAPSMHVFILQYFQPPNLKIDARFQEMIGYVIRWCTVIGAMIIFICSKKCWENIALFYRTILFAILMMALTEQLLRSTVMEIVVGYSWKSQLLSLIPTYVGYFVLSFLISFCIPILSRNVHLKFSTYFLFSILTTALVFFAKKITTNLVLPWISLIPPIDVSKIMHLPYGMNVLVPAYITFLEPTIASFIVFYLIEDKLKNFSTLSKGLILGGLISLIHAGVYSVVQIIYSDGNLIYRLFYYGQFLWEYFALGILTAYSFHFYRINVGLRKTA